MYVCIFACAHMNVCLHAFVFALMSVQSFVYACVKRVCACLCLQVWDNILHGCVCVCVWAFHYMYLHEICPERCGMRQPSRSGRNLRSTRTNFLYRLGRSTGPRATCLPIDMSRRERERERRDSWSGSEEEAVGGWGGAIWLSCSGGGEGLEEDEEEG